ncbi:winged helix-turn-helix domain-containing protein [Actinophytocola sp.]|uniref:ArsR/SmtB family transcription factor n=1 Tax=Actinophytocola sp. TaxID=1872138 RepID=UPI002D5D754C|nr:winged helix-turn-helix domain-containing protein [Actinophytocola sp.]HYQ65366.1 winged helix-turn-helix domain-containing protein [Actinophytocola sp.]
MTLRLVFGAEDLRRIRFAEDVDLMWELVLGLQMAQGASGDLPFMAWRQQLTRRIAVDRASWDAVASLRSLVAASGDFPDFLTPLQGASHIDRACELLSGVSPAHLRADVVAAFNRRAPSPQARSLACGDRRSFRDLVKATRIAHHLLVEPAWRHIEERVAAERTRRLRLWSTQGVDAMLRSLPGVLSWDDRVLRTRYPVTRTVRLNGRGIILIPAFFCWGNPITWIDPALPPVLVYQAHQRADPIDGHVDVPVGLVALLGRTRAESLRALLESRSTSELAQHLGTSVGTASKQTTVLRNAGLITSTRVAGSVLHRTTALGNSLLISTLPRS